jgi:hypothetical protein
MGTKALFLCLRQIRFMENPGCANEHKQARLLAIDPTRAD